MKLFLNKLTKTSLNINLKPFESTQSCHQRKTHFALYLSLGFVVPQHVKRCVCVLTVGSSLCTLISKDPWFVLIWEFYSHLSFKGLLHHSALGAPTHNLPQHIQTQFTVIKYWPFSLFLSGLPSIQKWLVIRGSWGPVWMEKLMLYLNVSGVKPDTKPDIKMIWKTYLPTSVCLLK